MEPNRMSRNMSQTSKRPPHVKPPAHLSPSPPVPEPREAEQKADPDGLSPVRYGDWERKGIAVDF
jgi:hypothetical protein